MYDIIGKQDKREISIIKDRNTIEPIQEVSDIAQTIKELNDDSLQEEKFTAIDTKTDLVELEINGILVVDTLNALGFMPTNISFLTRLKKRLAVSKKGRGRDDVVKIAQGMQEQGQGKSFMTRFGNMFRSN